MRRRDIPRFEIPIPAADPAAEDPDGYGFGHEEYGYEDEEGANGGLEEQAELEQGPEGLEEAET